LLHFFLIACRRLYSPSLCRDRSLTFLKILLILPWRIYPFLWRFSWRQVRCLWLWGSNHRRTNGIWFLILWCTHNLSNQSLCMIKTIFIDSWIISLHIILLICVIIKDQNIFIISLTILSCLPRSYFCCIPQKRWWFRVYCL
jgi:hypothetical protein